jgi:hypothetical protein
MGGAVSTRRFRGKGKGERWKRDADTELAGIRLPLAVHNDGEQRVERLYSAMWASKRTSQRDTRDAGRLLGRP